MSFIAAFIALTTTCNRSLRRRSAQRSGLSSTTDGFFARHLAPPVRFAFRYHKKRRQHRQLQLKTKQHGMDKIRDVRLPSEYIPLESVSNNGLLKLRTMGATPPAQANLDLAFLLGQYPTYASTAENLHYTDMKKLLLVSKTVHNAIVSTSKSYERLRNTTCLRGTETECWSCRSQVCVVRLSFPRSTLTAILDS